MSRSKLSGQKVHIIFGTHWDREWLVSFQETRQRLIELMRRVMELLENNKQLSFTLDGQFMAIENYLELRPNDKDRLKQLVYEGRLLVGPWYSLPDMPVLIGESIVRNLLLGITLSKQFGKVFPDCLTNCSWGQISQMPQICNGFGMDTYFSYHGVPAHKCPAEFRWEGADGSKVLFVRPPSIGRGGFWYAIEKSIRPDEKQIWATIKSDCNLFDEAYRLADNPLTDSTPFYGDDTTLPKNLDKALDVFKEYLKLAEKDTVTGQVMMGTAIDAGMPNDDIERFVSHIKENYCGNVEISSMTEYLQAVKNSKTPLELLKGELRYPAKESTTFRLMYPLSSRVYLKQQNREAEYLLTKWAEPFATMAWLEGARYPSEDFSYVWRMMLVNHSHDNIGGCSVDCVHDDMNWRFRQITEMGRAILHRSLGSLAKKIGNKKIHPNEIRLVVFNPTTYKRTEIFEASVCLPEDLPSKSVRVFNQDSKEVSSQILEKTELKSVVVNLPIQGRPTTNAHVVQLAIEAENVPPFGYAEYIVRLSPDTPGEAVSMPAGADWMENEYLKIKANKNGTISLTDKTNKQVFKNLHYFESGAQEKFNPANGWYYVPDKKLKKVNSRRCNAKIELVHNSAVRSQIRIKYDFSVMAASQIDETCLSSNVSITTMLTLNKGSRRVEVETFLNNQCKDYRLRVMFPTDVETSQCWADAPYDVVRRKIGRLDKDNWFEPSLGVDTKTSPMLSFVDLASPTRSLAIISSGLPEYEAVDDKKRTIALTLLRAFSNGRMDSDAPVPPRHGSQCQGPYTFRYAIFPHEGRWDKCGLSKESMSHNLPLKAIQSMRSGTGELPASHSFLRLTNDGLRITAVKKSDKKNRIIVRIVNLTSRTICSSLVCGFNVKTAQLANMLEHPIKHGDFKIIDKRNIPLQLIPKKIATLILESS